MSIELPSKAQRLQEFYRRLYAAPPAKSFEEAVFQMTAILNAVEDEYTLIPYDAAAAIPTNKLDTKGRMYPPELANFRAVAGQSHVKRYRHAYHQTFIAANGSIQVRVADSGSIVFSKAGFDGKGVQDK